MITEKDVKHIASLSKLEFNEEEIEGFVSDLNNIVNYVNTLAKVNTDDVKEISNLTPLKELRKDEIKQSLSQEEAIMNAPKQKDGGFSVPKVV